MKPEAVAFICDGRSMVPLDRFRPLFNRQFKPGREYVLMEHRGRSDASHNHYFACIKKGWENLPEDTAHRFPTPEYLRKWCLIKEGYADQVDHVCEDEKALGELVALVRKLDPYTVMQASGNVLTIWTAQSQDHASMGHEAFQTSKDRVMGRISNMIGISVTELARNAKENA